MADESEAEIAAPEVREWTPENDPDGVTQEEIKSKDWALEIFMDMIVGINDENRGSASITIQSNGAAISGLLISADEYFERFVDQLKGAGATDLGDAIGGLFDKLRGNAQEWTQKRRDEDLPRVARRFIHMKDVSIVIGPKVLKAQTWRGTLADVTGWSAGSFTFED